MLDKPKTCEGCPLEEIGQGFSEPEGTGSIPLLIVGESLGYNEMIQGLPFRPDAAAGSILHRIIRERGKFDRSSLAMWNLIGCHPPGDHLAKTSYEYSAVNHCRVHFDKVIKKYNPKVILALGNLPFKHLTGLEGYNLGIQNVRGYVFKSQRYPGVLVVPSLHPSFVRRGNSQLMGVLLWDLMKGVNLAQGKLKEGKDYILDPLGSNYANKTHMFRDWHLSYNINPTEDQALWFLDNINQHPELLIAYDIETETSLGESEDELANYGTQITQIQFSISPNSGIAFPYRDPFIQISKDILSSPNNKAGHNVWDFDNPILERNGFKINGRIDDTMWMFHHFQADLPLGLQFVSSFFNFPFPWKHYAGSDIEFYGIADVDSVQWIMRELPNKLKSRGLWEGYNKYVHELKPILVSMQDRGLPINSKKQEEFSIEIDNRKIEIRKELDKIIPEEFIKYHPENGYVREPKEVEAAIRRFINGEVRFDGGDNLIDGRSMLTVEQYVHLCTGLVKRKFSNDGKVISTKKHKHTQVDNLSDKDLKALEAIGIYDFSPEIPSLLQAEERWCKPLPFNPNSSDQVSNYIKYKDHEDLANRLMTKAMREARAKNEEEIFGKKKKDNVSTSKKVLELLADKTGELEYKLFVEWRELTKMKGAFIKGWTPELDECKHCEGKGNIAYATLLSDRGLTERKMNVDINKCGYCNGSGKSNYGRVHTTFTFRPASGQLSSRNPNCFSDDTEILTDKGWREFKLLSKDDRVAQYNPENGYINFVKPINYIKQTRNEPLVHIYTEEQIDLLVTLDHDCLLKNRKGQFKIYKANEYPEDHTQVQAGLYQGGYKLFSKAQLILIAALQADGSITPNGSYDFAFSKERKRERFLTALTQEGIKYKISHRQREGNRKPQQRFYISFQDIPEWWRDKKIFGEWVLQLTEGCFQFLADEIFNWDGLHERKSNYSSKYKINADWVQILQILTNRRAKIRRYNYKDYADSWQVDVSQNRNGSLTTNICKELVEYDRDVYCVEVPTHSIVVRRNGKVSITNQCQQGPKISTLAPKFRETIEARPGHLLVELDMKSYHAMMLGYLALDRDYMRLANLDIHSYLTSHMVQHPQRNECISWPDDKLKEFLSSIKSQHKRIRDDQAKHAILGIGFGLSEKGCYERYKEDFNPKQSEILDNWGTRKRNKPMDINPRTSITYLQEEIERIGFKRVKDIYKLLRSLFPKVFKWQEKTIVQADSVGYIQTPYGFRRWFNAASEKKYDRFGNLLGTKKGEEAEKALAYPVSNNAHIHMRETMLLLEQDGYLEKYRLCNMIHDSLIFEPKENDIDDLVKNVVPIMQRTSTILINEFGGFSCGVDGKVGRNMRTYNDDPSKGEICLDGMKELII